MACRPGVRIEDLVAAKMTRSSKTDYPRIRELRGGICIKSLGKFLGYRQALALASRVPGQVMPVLSLEREAVLKSLTHYLIQCWVASHLCLA